MVWLRLLSSAAVISFVSFPLLAENLDRTDYVKALQTNPHGQQLSQSYEAANTLLLVESEATQTHWDQFTPQVGLHSNGPGSQNGTIKVLTENPNLQIYFLADFNRWGLDLDPVLDALRPVDNSYFVGTVRELSHGMQYRLLVVDEKGNAKQVLDPAAELFTSTGLSERLTGISDPSPALNSVYWDFDRPDAYRMTSSPIDLHGVTPVIAEVEAYGLVSQWKANHQVGPAALSDTYHFIATSGVITQLKTMGYNAVEFLPFTMAVDGGDWKFHYLNWGPFALDSHYGTPDDFAQMVDNFNREGIAVLMDAVPGHYPSHGNQGIRELRDISLATWKKSDGSSLFGDAPTIWGTNRFDYSTKTVRTFLTEGILTMIRRYRLSGFRLDNVDGIVGAENGINNPDYTNNSGLKFLFDVGQSMHRYQPSAFRLGEVYGANPTRLIAPFEPSQPADLSNGGGFEWEYHVGVYFDFMAHALLETKTDQINLQPLVKTLKSRWASGQVASMSYLTNHDLAGGVWPGSPASGAFPATLLKNAGFTEQQSLRRIKAFGTLPFFATAASRDLPQVRLAQSGDFNQQSAIEWDRLKSPGVKALNTYFSALSKIVGGEQAFALQNYTPDTIRQVDDSRKIISFRHINFATSKAYYGVINFGKTVRNYALTVDDGRPLLLSLDSEAKEFGGHGHLAKGLAGTTMKPSKLGSSLERSIRIPYLEGMSSILLETE